MMDVSKTVSNIKLGLCILMIQGTVYQNHLTIYPKKKKTSPFTVRVTSLSATPIRGTMALHVYVPAASWVTAGSFKVFLLLST